MDVLCLFPELDPNPSITATPPFDANTKLLDSQPQRNPTGGLRTGISFSAAVQNRPSWTLPGPAIEPVRKGTHLSIPINSDFYDARVSDCIRSSMIGRVILPKGSSPWKLHELKETLRQSWEASDWTMLSIGHGYFIFRFDQESTRDKVLHKSAWKLTRGVLYTQPWVPDFVPAKASATKAKI